MLRTLPQHGEDSQFPEAQTRLSGFHHSYSSNELSQTSQYCFCSVDIDRSLTVSRYGSQSSAESPPSPSFSFAGVGFINPPVRQSTEELYRSLYKFMHKDAWAFQVERTVPGKPCSNPISHLKFSDAGSPGDGSPYLKPIHFRILSVISAFHERLTSASPRSNQRRNFCDD